MAPRATDRIRVLELIDMQAGGDVSRIVLDGVRPVPGRTVLEQARALEAHGDGLRRLLLSDPYGDPAMSVDLVLPATHPDAEVGYVIMEAMGYPPYSGSNTMCTATAVLQAGLVPMPDDGTRKLSLESPAGLAHVTAQCRDGWVEAVTVSGEPAFVADRDLVAHVAGYGEVVYDLVWSGGFYALTDAAPLGFALVREEEATLAAFGEAFMQAVHPGFAAVHPMLGYAGPLPFLHLAGPLERVDEQGYRSRSATYVHPGVICRSPTGTGTTARLARLADRGHISEGQWLETTSPRGSSFRGTVMGPARVGAYAGLHTEVTGRAWTLSHTRILVDLDDPMVETHDLEHLLATTLEGSVRW